MADPAAIDSTDIHVTADTDELLQEGTVVVSGKEWQLKLTSNGLTLTQQPAQKKNKDLSLTWREVICVKDDPKATGIAKDKSFLLYYMHMEKKNVKRHRSLTVQVKDGQADSWISVIKEQYNKVPGRPKKLFVIINPIGGSTRARQSYAKIVAPLFELAEIEVTSVVTERSKHALEIGENQDFTGYDGIIILGGDGLFHEVVQGFFLQLQKKTGTDYNNPDAPLTKVDIPLGHIPTGTGNGVSGWCNGTLDIETAVLNVIRGEVHRAQIMTTYGDGKFICVTALTLAYGEIADLLKRTDDLRWLKRARYPFAIIGMVTGKRRAFNCEVSYHVAEDKEDSKKESSGKAEEADDNGWITFKTESTNYTGIASWICEQVDGGNSYIPTSFSDRGQLWINTNSSGFGLLKFMYELGTNKKPMSQIPNISHICNFDAYRFKIHTDDSESTEPVSAARARQRELEHLLESDGEFYRVENMDVLAKIRPGFIPCFGILPQVPPTAIQK